ncbi:MAG: ribose 5-phosphate isomerase B [Patescibacteria group bacterium]
MQNKKIYIASDHAGYRLKKRLIRFITNELKLELVDLGPEKYNKDDDYPDYAVKVCQKILKEKTRGILICGTGIGMCITANKIKGIRAALVTNIKMAEAAAKHNNANCLCLGGKILSEDFAMAIIKTWLKTEYKKETRHERRLKKIEAQEKK